MASADYKHLDDRIKALTGIDTSSEVIQGYIEDWIKDAIREIYSVVPKHEKVRYTILSSSASASTGITVKEPVLSVIFAPTSSFDSEDTYEAREVSYNHLYRANKHYSMFRGLDGDPLFYYEPQTSGTAQLIKAIPSDGYIKVVQFDIPNWDTEGSYNASEITTINTVPNEIDHLIILNASIKATTYLLQNEQDEDIYVPLLNTLKADYVQSVQLYLTQFQTQAQLNKPETVSPSRGKATAEELQKLMQKYG
jgi:hypothetical protein